MGVNMKQEIEVTIAPDGRVTLRPKGTPGPACLDLTEEIEAALGDVESRELTSDYYQQGVEADGRVRGRAGRE